jgi:hypothetical protein
MKRVPSAESEFHHFFWPVVIVICDVTLLPIFPFAFPFLLTIPIRVQVQMQTKRKSEILDAVIKIGYIVWLICY